MTPFNPLKHADPLLEHAEHHVEATGRVCSADLAQSLFIPPERAVALLVALDWQGSAGGVAA